MELDRKIDQKSGKDTLVLTNPVNTELVLRIDSIELVDTTESLSKVFYTVSYSHLLLVAKPAVFSHPAASFTQSFTVDFDEPGGELIIIKVYGITSEGSETLVGTVKYHV